MNKKAWDHPWSFMGLHTPRKVPWKGILKQGRFPLKIACRVPAIFWGVAAACFSTDACWRSSCALPGQEKHGSAIHIRSLRLEDIDWDRETLHVRYPKDRNARTYPLSQAVGN